MPLRCPAPRIEPMRVPHFLPFIFLAALGNALASPSIEQWQTGQEVRTLFVVAPELPMLDIAVTFGAGSDRDAELAGLSQLTHGLLSAGSCTCAC